MRKRIDQRDSVHFLLVQNKNGLGGVETIVQEFANYLREKDFGNSVFSIWNSKYLLLNSHIKFIRRIIFFFAIPRLLISMILRLLFNRKKIIVIFFHAESHILNLILRKFTKKIKRITTINSLNQSPKIYPRKMLESAARSIEESDYNICYSQNVSKLWMNLTEKNIEFLSLATNSVNLPVKITNRMDNQWRFLHISRNVEWKKPLESLKLALTVSKMGYKVRIDFVGINHLNTQGLVLDDQIEIHYHGEVRDLNPLITSSDALFNLYDSNMSGEVIGLGALRALCQGVPVVVENLEDTSYGFLNGIIDNQFFLNEITKNLPYQPNFESGCLLSPSDIIDNRKKLSYDKYFNDLMQIIYTSY